MSFYGKKVNNRRCLKNLLRTDDIFLHNSLWLYRQLVFNALAKIICACSHWLGKWMQSLDVQWLDQLAYHINSLPQGPNCCSPPQKKTQFLLVYQPFSQAYPRKFPRKMWCLAASLPQFQLQTPWQNNDQDSTSICLYIYTVIVSYPYRKGPPGPIGFCF